MDVFEFIEGIAGNVDSTSYAHDASTCVLRGRSFQAYYRNLLLSRFRDSFSPHFGRHCLLNFMVQQLAVRATFRPELNKYLFIGDDPIDVAASLLGMLPVITPEWVSPNITAEKIQRVDQLLNTCANDDLKSVSAINIEPIEFLRSGIPNTYGVIVNCTPQRDLHFMTAALRLLSVGGTALWIDVAEQITDEEHNSLYSQRYKEYPAQSFGGSLVLMRKTHDC